MASSNEGATKTPQNGTFHKDIRNDTRDYQYLKKEIIFLLKRYLGDLVSDRNQRNEIRLIKEVPRIVVASFGRHVA